MSSISDHIQLMKSQEKQYDSMFNKREWLYINDTVTQYDQGTSIIEITSLSNNSKFLDYNSAYLCVPLKNIASGESFNHLVSNGISNLKAVLIIPHLNTLNNNVKLFDVGQPQLLGHMYNLYVLLGGSNVLHADAR